MSWYGLRSLCTATLVRDAQNPKTLIVIVEYPWGHPSREGFGGLGLPSLHIILYNKRIFYI